VGASLLVVFNALRLLRSDQTRLVTLAPITSVTGAPDGARAS
jgi:hypothetical protein